jgi:trimethylamine:corrinoid methyltransferase-like protein
MIRPKLEFLSPEAVQRAIDEAYELLWDPGVRVHYDEAFAACWLMPWRHGGRQVARGQDPARSLAEKALETAPSSFYLYDYDGEPVVHYGATTFTLIPARRPSRSPTLVPPNRVRR